jgi:DHA2 family multidrug resistance protein-like MFS transporter
MAVLDARSPAALAAQEAFVTAMQITSIVAAALTAIAAVVAWKLIPSLRERESPGIRTEGGH